MSQKKKVSYIIHFIVAVLIFVINFIIQIPPFKKITIRNDPIKTCYSNIRVLQGAVEMYNMDSDDDNQMKELDMDLLLDKKYIKNKPLPPKPECKYSSYGDLLGNGYIYCDSHGGVSDDPPKIKKKMNQIELKKDIWNSIVLFGPSILYLLFVLM